MCDNFFLLYPVSVMLVQYVDLWIFVGCLLLYYVIFEWFLLVLNLTVIQTLNECQFHGDDTVIVFHFPFLQQLKMFIECLFSFGRPLIMNSKVEESSQGSKHQQMSKEDQALVEFLLELKVTNKFISENGFKPRFLNQLKLMMQDKLPGCGLRGQPHINSRIRTLKNHW